MISKSAMEARLCRYFYDKMILWLVKSDWERIDINVVDFLLLWNNAWKSADVSGTKLNKKSKVLLIENLMRDRVFFSEINCLYESFLYPTMK